MIRQGEREKKKTNEDENKATARRLTFGSMMMAGENVASGRRPWLGRLAVPSDDRAGSKKADMALLNRTPLCVLNLEPK